MNEDLSIHHSPLTGMFPDGKGAREFAIGDDLLEFFNLHGYLKGIPVLSDEQVDALRAELAALMEPAQAENPLFYEYHHNESTEPGKALFHALGAWRVSKGFHDLLFHPAFTVPAGQILGGPVRFWHDQLFVKPAHDGAVVAWHQDYSYWTRTKPVAHLTCWIGLDDSTLENGCVHYVPGSHKWDLLPRTDLAGNMTAVLDVLTAEQKARFKPVAIELKKGEASFHHPMMLHGSYENSSERPRRACVINVFRDGALSDSDEPLLAGIPPIPKGLKIEGRFFPLLAGSGLA
jgi:ectoine hydroxylase-related dioxygenase (phytanoyl-CoA dioxygenase family)